MDQDEAALLAELRAISSKASASSRFDDDNDNGGVNIQQQHQPDERPLTAASAAERLVVAAGNLHDALEQQSSPRSIQLQPPSQMLLQQQQQQQGQLRPPAMRRRSMSGSMQSNNNNTPPASPTVSISSSKHSSASAPAASSTLRASRAALWSRLGGNKKSKNEDDEMPIPPLDHADDDDDDDNDENLSNAATKEPPKRTNSWSLPVPWKRGNSKEKLNNNDDNNDEEVEEEEDRISVARSGGKKLQSSISSNNDNNDAHGVGAVRDRIVEARKAYGDVAVDQEEFIPPISRNQAMHLDPPPPLVVVTTTTQTASAPPPPLSPKMQTNESSLSMVSSNSTTGGGSDENNIHEELQQQQQRNPSFSPTNSRSTDRFFSKIITVPTPPASPRHAAAAAAAQKAKSSPVVVRANTGGGGGGGDGRGNKSNNTFSGERGGNAEDAELLALLRNVSNKSGAASRFGDDDDTAVNNENQTGGSRSSEPSIQSKNAAAAAPPAQESSSFPAALSSLSPSKSKPSGITPPRKHQQQQPSTTTTANGAAATATVVENPGYGIKSSIPSKFSGERGGAAEDAELLALLRGVSNKSGAADRFGDDDDNNDDVVVNENQVAAQAPDSPSKSKRSGTPPWKKRGPKQQQQQAPDDDIDIVVAAPPPPRPYAAATKSEKAAGYGIKSNIPSTFSGERGGAAEDAELLALLRGVSNKSGAADRFGDDSNSNNTNHDFGNIVVSEHQGGVQARNNSVVVAAAKPTPAPAAVSPSKSKPWQKQGPMRQQPPSNGADLDDIDIVVAAPPPPRRSVAANQETARVAQNQPAAAAKGGIKPDMPSTFSGERGGAAEDAELLALLRGVSNKSGAADRFGDDNDHEVNPNHGGIVESRQVKAVVAGAAAAQQPAQASPTKSQRSGTPPWKKRGPKQQQQSSANGPFDNQIDIVVAAPPPARSLPASEAPAAHQVVVGAGIKSEMPSTFKGERGGAAEDPELLALLRGVSSKSGAADRFANDDDSTQNKPAPSNEVVATSKSSKGPLRHHVGNKHEKGIDVVVGAPRQAPSPVVAPSLAASSGYGIKSDIPSTFSGERGGAAEDAELLALLRGVSSGANRFGDMDQQADFQDVTGLQHPDPPTSSVSKKLAPSHPDPPAMRASKKLPAKPWQQRGNVTEQTNDVDEVVAAPRRGPEAESMGSSGFGIKSDTPSTFSGERGGAAEDAELLALLRGVSNKSGGGSRFNEAIAKGETEVHQETARSVGTPKKQSSAFVEMSMSAQSPPSEQPDGSEEERITMDDLPEALISKDWKLRAQAFGLLKSILTGQTQGKEPTSDVDADSILQGLDDIVRTMPDESNAMALDKALDFLIAYATHCRRAGDAEQAAAIMSSVVTKNALSSRPSTLNLSTLLALKLMEVGTDGNASVNAVVDVLLSKGLASRKPKVVQASASILLAATKEFGAVNLPLASVVSSSPKMFSHVNAQVRTIGLEILAEFCRVLGSKAPLQEAIDSMKKAQVAEMDTMLAKQPDVAPPRRKLRSQLKGDSSSSPEDALAALQAGAKEREAQRFASRPAVKLMEVLPGTEYYAKLALPKWSEQVAALKIVLDAGGEKPYKLEQPCPTANYGPLISEMKKLLSHTHFAVCSKAMEVLSMLAEGVGEKLFPHLRPILATLLALSKDKKLTKGVGSCLDSFFGNVLSFDHLLDPEDALPMSLEERKEKNALARASALEFLERSVRRRETAGRRGVLSPGATSAIADLCTKKLDDSDASVRKAVMGVFQALQAVEDEECRNLVSVKIDALKASHARVHKTLTNATADQGNAKKSPSSGKSAPPPKAASPAKDVRSSQPPAPKRSPPAAVNSRAMPKADRVDDSPSSNFYTPILEEAVSHIGALRIPQWDAPEDDGGVFAGLHSSAWIKRQDAIKSITAFVESGQLGGGTKDVYTNSSSILVVVRECTRGFNETNVNIMKSILLLFVALCDYHEAAECEFMDWGTASATLIAVQKLSDRKLSDSCKTLLSTLCATSRPGNVLLEASKVLKPLKSPVIHEEYLKWFKVFCGEFGAVSIGSSVSDIIPWILSETASLSPKVKLEALSAAGVLHRQLGPGFKALTLSMVQDTASRDQLEKCFNSNPFEPSLQSQNWPRQSIAASATGSKENNNPGGGGLVLEVPKLDLIAQLPDDCLSRMGSKDGKTAWKQRKSAIDEVDETLKVCNGLVDTSASKFKPLVDLMRGLRDRLGDTQINLKPLAARVIGVFLGHVDKPSQAKLGKIVFGPLINAAMNDIKKQMREASIKALRQGTTSSSLDGGGPNQESLGAFLSSFIGEVNETAVRSGGLADVLSFVLTLVEYLPNLDEIVASRGQSLGENYAAVLVACLTSSKSETRAAATTLLELSINKNVVSLTSVRKTTEKMKPATQRSVGAIIVKFSQKLAPSTSDLRDDQDRPAVPPPGDVSRRPSRTSSSSSSIPGVRPTVGTRPAAARANGGAAISANQPPPTHRGGGDVAPSSKHPLASCNRRVPSKPIVWPEFPEEPTGSPIFGTLKNLWAPMLPGPSAAILFPKTGILKQDDAKEGCELLSAAIDADRLCRDSEVERQLDCIVKWIVYVLCCREATVGLQALITLIKKLFLFLCEIRRPLSDSDAMMLAPFILEKASNAKGRFGESLMELVSIMQSEELMPAKRLGAVACVAVMERSNHAKSRALASRICVECIARAGLPSVGKKGVLVAAKALSTEHIPENKAAALDLMEAILEKMQGDVPKLVKVCGPHLSNKAREDIEDRWRKYESMSRTSTAMGFHAAPSTPASQREGILRDELPALTLRETVMEQGRPTLKQRIVEIDTTSDDPFAFAPAARKGISPNSLSSNDRTEFANEGSSKAESLATAASLRARLLRIRGQGFVDGESNGSRIIQQTSSAPVSYPKDYFDKGIATVGGLTSKQTRVSEGDADLLAAVDVFKTFHAALSQEPNQGTDGLRHEIKSNLSITIENITNCIAFAFQYVDSITNGDISFPLLFPCLSTLMQLMRDEDFTTNVSADDLVLLLRGITTAMLDARLVDSGTTAQLVRGINKAAVVAVTNSARHTSFQALLTMLQQLSVEGPTDIDQEHFNRRQSRVLNKLFLKVIEQEEKAECPFSTTRVDMESLLCCLEDVLVALRDRGHSIDSDDSCSDLIRCLVRSLIKSYEGTEVLRHQIDDLGIDPMASCLGELISFCLDQQAEAEASKAPPETSESVLVPSVASLVSAMGMSKEGPERQAALEALREYKNKHGDAELDDHLQKDVSATFRDFIKGQLNGGEPSPEKMPYDSGASNMSERLRNLRSRLQASGVQTVPSREEEEEGQQLVQEEAKPPSPSDAASVSSPSTRGSRIPSPSARGSRLARPSPSRLPQPKKTSLSVGSRTQQSPAQPSLPSTTMANAAAGSSSSTTETEAAGKSEKAAQLRARLEAAKHQSIQG